MALNLSKCTLEQVVAKASMDMQKEIVLAQASPLVPLYWAAVPLKIISVLKLMFFATDTENSVNLYVSVANINGRYSWLRV